MRLDIDLQIASEAPVLPSAALFRHWVNNVLQGESEREAAELTIRIVDEAEGKQLNETWRNRIGPTNVLSFPFEALTGVDVLEIPLLGDIIICAPVVLREAHEQGKLAEAHWAHLVIHGTLHLLGYDHETEEEASIMETRETRLLNELGYPDPYQIM